jgi:hypothetical protein
METISAGTWLTRPVADRQHRVGGQRLLERDLVLERPDRDPAHDVDGGNDEARHGVAFDELAGPVHGAEERRLLLQLLAPQFRLVLVDQARRQVGVDRHLLARHGVQRETRRHLRDPPRPLGDDHEVHEHQDQEHDHPDDERPPIISLPNGLDHLTSAVRAFVPVAQDQARGGEVQAEPEQRGHQQHRRKRGELQRPLDQQRRHQDQHRRGDRQRQQHVQQQGRDRQDQQADDGDDAERQPHLAPQQPAADLQAGDLGRGGPGELAHSLGRMRAHGRRHGHPGLAVFFQLVAQGADRDAQDVGRVRAVA